MGYCCVTDVVTRALPVPQSVKFPEARLRLLQLMSEDQAVRASKEFHSTDRDVAIGITKRELARMDEVLAILKLIKTPSRHNIGLDGSRAVWIIALHNFNYRNSGRIVADKMKRLFYRNKNEVFYPGLPFLIDRIMAGSQQPLDPERRLPYQLYGTQGLSFTLPDGTKKSVPFPIIDKARLSERRRKFDLEPKSSCKHTL